MYSRLRAMKAAVMGTWQASEKEVAEMAVAGEGLCLSGSLWSVLWLWSSTGNPNPLHFAD